MKTFTKNLNTLLIIILHCLLINSSVSAQAPDKMSYQAVIRNAADNLVANSPIGMKISILQGSETGVPVYVETQTPTSNANGLVSLEIGNGSVVSGDFGSIDWSVGPYFIKTETDPTGGNNYTITGTSQMMSVPYALYAETSGSSTPYAAGAGIDITGNVIENTAPDQPVNISGTGATTVSGFYPDFIIHSTDEVNDADSDPTNEIELPASAIDGQVLTWNGGDWIAQNAGSGADNWGSQVVQTNGSNISGDGTAGSPLTVTEVDGSVTNEIQTITKLGSTVTLSNGGGSFTDAVNDADNDPTNEIELPASATNGQVLTWNGSNWVAQNAGSGADNWGSQVVQTNGSNISGDGTAGSPLTVTEVDGSTTNEIQTISKSGNTVTLSNGGGSFTDAVNDADADATNEIQDISLSGNNLSISDGSTVDLSGVDNGGWSTTGNAGTDPNTNFIGTTDLAPIIFKVGNQFVGKIGGSNSDLFLGINSGNNSVGSIGKHNIGIGPTSLRIISTGQDNTAIGYQSLYNTTTGFSNTGIGYSVLFSNNSGSFNVAVGFRALYKNTTGSNNTANGNNALFNNTTGYSNVAIGSRSLYKNTTKSNLVAIGDSALYNNISGIQNTAIGSKSLFSNTSGSKNTALGMWSLYANTTGYDNTALGFQTLGANTIGTSNVAIGRQSLMNNISGVTNTAIGNFTLFTNSSGNNNVAIGYQALRKNTTASNNVAMGSEALKNNTTAPNNTAVGYRSSFLNTTGTRNTAVGTFSFYNNVTGIDNSAIGYQALTSNVDGIQNVANGVQALFANKGNYNVASGYRALFNNNLGFRNVAVGNQALLATVSGIGNTAIGDAAGSSGDYNNRTAIGSFAINTASNQVRIGNSIVTSIGGFANWSNVSDRRFKKDIKENVAGLNFILKLRPVTYHLDMEAIARTLNISNEHRIPDAEQEKGAALQTGFIAQEVEQSAAELGYDFSGVDAPKNAGDYYGLRYAEFVVPLVKATQEQQALIEQQQTQIKQQQNEIDELKNLVNQLLNKQ